jgi:hypothetical protein
MIQRRSFIASVVGMTIAGRAAAQLSPSTSLANSPSAGPLFATPPMAWAVRADGIDFLWTVTRLSRGRVEMRGALEGATNGAGAMDEYGFVPQSAGIMRVNVNGLQPGSTYEWRAVVEAIDGEAEREETPWRTFRTLDPDAATAHFCIWNDTHANHDTVRMLHGVTPPADFLLWNGDTCNDWHQEEWLVPTLMAPGGVNISEGRPLLLTMGNHDIRGKFAFRVRDHIAMPENRPYYAFRSGPVAIIALNTGEDKPDDHPSFQGRVAMQRLRETQADWLRVTIQRPEFANAPYRVVFCHIPLRWREEPENVDYAGGEWDAYARSSRDLWHDSLTTWGAQLVLSGHTHSPASIPPRAGFPYHQITGGGPQTDRATWTEVKADGQALTVVMRLAATGEVLHSESFAPL